MKALRFGWVVVWIIAWCGISRASADNHATLQVTLVGEDGELLPVAPVYLRDEKHGQFLPGRTIHGSATLTLNAGTYGVSSAFAQRNGDFTDRYCSREAHIDLRAGEHESVILTLRKISDPMPMIVYHNLRNLGANAHTLTQ